MSEKRRVSKNARDSINLSLKERRQIRNRSSACLVEFRTIYNGRESTTHTSPFCWNAPDQSNCAIIGDVRRVRAARAGCRRQRQCRHCRIGGSPTSDWRNARSKRTQHVRRWEGMPPPHTSPSATQCTHCSNLPSLFSPFVLLQSYDVLQVLRWLCLTITSCFLLSGRKSGGCCCALGTANTIHWPGT